MAAPVDLVLFDLGGVLVELSGVPAMLELTGVESEEDLWRRWLTRVTGVDEARQRLAEAAVLG